MTDVRLVEAEWIGLRNHLGEVGRARRRGRYATSADLLLAYEDGAGDRHGVLLESKYSEHYLAAKPGRMSAAGRDRLEIYREQLERADGPLSLPPEVPAAALLVEPFDQHLRQQLLAAAMERVAELGFRTVTVVHVAPRANEAFHRGITSPQLIGRGATVGSCWSALLRNPLRYRSIAYEDVFRAVESAGHANPQWLAYQRARYAWGSDG